MSQQKEMLKLVYLMAEYHGYEISDGKAMMLAGDLENLSIQQINAAWKIYRLSSKGVRMPTVGQLAELIDDGNPSAQIAWNMIPKDEDSSTFWTEEMRLAWAVANDQIREGNITGAFFAFKETYERALNDSRFSGRKTKWSPSFGFDKSKRETAVIEAIVNNRISLGRGLDFYPELEYSPKYESLQLTYGKTKPEHLEHKSNKGMALVASLESQIKTLGE